MNTHLTEREIGMYYGCLAKLEHIESPIIIRGVRYSQVLCEYTDEVNKHKKHWRHIEDDNIKLYLRPLSDLTEEEAIQLTVYISNYGSHPLEGEYKTFINQFNKIVVSWGDSHKEKYCPENETLFTPLQFEFLIKHGFDIFNHLENNKAIAKTIRK